MSNHYLNNTHNTAQNAKASLEEEMANLKEQLVKVEREKRELVPYSAVEVSSIMGVVQIMVRHISFKLSANSSSEFSVQTNLLVVRQPAVNIFVSRGVLIASNSHRGEQITRTKL